MNPKELEKRTKRFALKIIEFVGSWPRGKVFDVIGYQLLKSGTSIGANHREANRGQSYDDFIHKIGIVEKEASETQFWLEICEERKLGLEDQRMWLLLESGELLAIFTATGKTAKLRRAAKSRLR